MRGKYLFYINMLNISMNVLCLYLLISIYVRIVRNITKIVCSHLLVHNLINK